MFDIPKYIPNIRKKKIYAKKWKNNDYLVPENEGDQEDEVGDDDVHVPEG